MTERQAPQPEQARSMRLVSTLAVSGMVMGLLLVSVHRVTEPAILAHKARVLQQAISEVLGDPARHELLYVLDGALTRQLPEGVNETEVERVYLGYDADDARIGFAIAAGEPGFQDVVGLIFGFDPVSGRVLGMKVLESKETPGLGDKIEKDEEFVGQFAGAIAPLVGVKAGRGSGDDPSEVDLITGATISSRAIVRIINNALERLRPALVAYDGEASG
jgi:electron transport complex protein RnfG